MENVKIKLPVIEFNFEQSIVKRYVTLFVIIIGASFIIVLNSIILNAIPNMYSGSIMMNAIFLFIPNAILGSVATSLMSLEIILGKVRIKKNKLSLPFFLFVTGILSVTCSSILNWAAGCSSDACDIREACNYLIKLPSIYAFTLLICCLISFLIAGLLFKYLYKKINSLKWVADLVFPEIKKK